MRKPVEIKTALPSFVDTAKSLAVSKTLTNQIAHLVKSKRLTKNELREHLRIRAARCSMPGQREVQAIKRRLKRSRKNNFKTAIGQINVG